MHFDAQQFRRQLSHWLDGAIGDDDFRALQETLRENPDARQVYLDYMGLNSLLRDSAAAREHLDGLLSLDACDARPIHDRVALPASPWAHGLLFSTAAVVFVAVGVWLLSEGRRGEPGVATTGAIEVNPVVLARVVRESDDCQWYVEQGTSGPTAALHGGQTVRVVKGKLKLTYNNGVELLLHAPAVYELLTEMQAKMVLGRMTASVSEAGLGFTVLTPRAAVIDLGTEFGVDVNNDGATDVAVFKGAVDIDCSLGAGHQGGGATPGRAQRLHMGEGVRLDAAGTASRIVSITNQQFAERSPTAPRRQPLITAVQDNVRREDLWNYYEICHGGMAEDALAFVDRLAHEYNGVDASGMPAYLIGGDYVKTFNNDKVRHELRINVTLSGPARLYVLVDDRLDPPDWLTERFHDTGDNIGVDTGPFESTKTPGVWHNHGPAGVGPGESVEDTLSVWACEVTEAGSVQLGAIEDPEIGANMYGIVAVPAAPTD